MSWNRADTELPPEGEKVTVITASGDERELVFQDNLWWLPDLSMYVYFQPVFWKKEKKP